MTSLTLSKSTLNKEKQNLKAYNRYLPALELKRQQLLAELQKAKASIKEAEQQLENVLTQVANELPMLSRENVDIEKLVKIDKAELSEENIVGTKVPFLKELTVHTAPYCDLAMPHWVDLYVELMQKALKWQLEQQIRKERLEKLSKASRTTAQRVNLFSKVLIPRGKKSIRKIQVYLSDQDRAGIINAKLAKARGKIEQGYEEHLQIQV